MNTSLPSFNLVDENWIPVVGVGLVSLRRIFEDNTLIGLGGNALNKIAVYKLLQAIAQAAWTPKDEAEWRCVGMSGMAERCVAYLEKWHDHFYLYGPMPFLQMPGIVGAAVQPYAAVMPEISSGNTTVLNHSQIGLNYDNAQRALLLIQLMGFGLGGKKTDNSIVLTSGYAGKFNDKGKPSTGASGPSLSHYGLLHTMLLGTSVQGSVWLNLFDQTQISKNAIYSGGLGKAPWEDMPIGESCVVAQALQTTLMGRLVPLSRFVLFTEAGMHYSEGIRHLDYNSGIQDPTVAVENNPKKVRVLWVNPDKRPWRELTGLMSFLMQQKSKNFECWQLSAGIPRLNGTVDSFGVWSGGLSVNKNAGEQYVTGRDGMVESKIWLESAVLNESWLVTFQQEMDWLDTQAKKLYGCTMAYFKELKAEGDNMAARASSMFWHESESIFSDIVQHCGGTAEDLTARESRRKKCTALLQDVYNRTCPNNTARQMPAWAVCRPR